MPAAFLQGRVPPGSSPLILLPGTLSQGFGGYFNVHIYSQVPYFIKIKLTFLKYRPRSNPQLQGVPGLGVSGHLYRLTKLCFSDKTIYLGGAVFIPGKIFNLSFQILSVGKSDRPSAKRHP